MAEEIPEVLLPACTVTKPFLHDGITYAKGDVVTSHDLAERFITLGVAKHAKPQVPTKDTAPKGKE